MLSFKCWLAHLPAVWPWALNLFSHLKNRRRNPSFTECSSEDSKSGPAKVWPMGIVVRHQSRFRKYQGPRGWEKRDRQESRCVTVRDARGAVLQSQWFIFGDLVRWCQRKSVVVDLSKWGTVCPKLCKHTKFFVEASLSAYLLQFSTCVSCLSPPPFSRRLFMGTILPPWPLACRAKVGSVLNATLCSVSRAGFDSLSSNQKEHFWHGNTLSSKLWTVCPTLYQPQQNGRAHCTEPGSQGHHQDEARGALPQGASVLFWVEPRFLHGNPFLGRCY